jgi:glycosyltransferase involved in cell wall biosynthesis
VEFTFGYHPRFDELIPPWRAIAGPTVLVAAKIERYRQLFVPRVMLDVLLRSEAGLHPLLLCEVEPGSLRLPEALREAGDLPQRVIATLGDWIAERLASETAQLTIFDRSPAYLALAQRPDGAAVPGLAAYGRLFDICDRYRAVKPFASGRRVIELGAGSGFGLHLLRACARSVQRADPAPEDVDLALGFERAPAGATAELVIAFGVAPDAVAPTYARARALCGPHGIVAISALEPGGAQALAALGFAAAPLVRVAADTAPPLAEALAVIVPPQPAAHVAAPDPPPRAAIAASARPLRVLFALRPSAAVTFGGDVVQVRNTAAALVRRGHDAQVTQERAFDPAGFDIVHFSNITSPFETIEQMNSIAGFRGAVVLMPIFTDHADETALAIRAQSALFGAPSDSDALRAFLDGFAARTIEIEVDFLGRTVLPSERVEMAPNYLVTQREIARRSDFLIANAHAEVHRFYRYIDPSIPYAVAPSAIDPALYRPEAAAAFRSVFALEEYVLLTGRIEPRKNQALLLYALRESGRNVVLIGRNADAAYGAVVRAYLGRRTFVFHHMPEAELAGAIAAARVVALPSFDEVVSLSSLNAAACEASLVLTRQSYEHEYFRDDAEYCDPSDYRSIAAAVDRAWTTHDERLERRRELSARVRREYTWDRSAEATEAAYYRVLAFNPRGRARIARAG